MQSLEQHHLLRLQRFAHAASKGEDVSALSEDMMVSLGPLLTEARLDAAMKEAKDGKYRDRDFPGELMVADAIVAEAKVKEEAEAKAKEDAILKDAQDVMGLSPAEVDAAVAEAESKASDEEKKTGFWTRIGGFFKGLFVGKKEKEKEGTTP
jgi:hypothetical protein